LGTVQLRDARKGQWHRSLFWGALLSASRRCTRFADRGETRDVGRVIR